jgi:predicted dehydrogenase
MKNIKLGIIGLGIMGLGHARVILGGKIRRLELVAVSDPDTVRLAQLPPGVHRFTHADELIRSGLVEAVLIATPHFFHAAIGEAALRAGLHVLIEKPLTVHKAEAERLLATPRRRGQVFAAMFNQRTDPAYRHLRELVRSRELGAIRRVNWIITTWFRPQAYYDAGGWRATWAGEGGGVLINQALHQLDLLSWLFGQPVRVRAFCHFGRYHDIEVEDDVTAYVEFSGGATGVFITSTGEYPGVNRLEITAERGLVIHEDGQITISRNARPTTQFSRRTRATFGKPGLGERRVFRAKSTGGQHTAILQNFSDAIVSGRPLLAPAADGLRSVELVNAMLLSSWTNRTVDLPLDGALYARWLRRKIAASTGSTR